MNPIEYLLNIPSKKIKYGLSRTDDLLKMCENPEEKIVTIQIVGTNGKGSVSSFLANILQDGGYKIGLYTSPHLINLKERIRINKKMITDIHISNFITKYEKQIEKIQPSFFELLTVIAIWHFKQNHVDFAILETGLGGRLDSVTACKNSYVLFTSISSDHEDILGPSLKNIAKEKGGAILNSRQVCISINQNQIIKKTLTKQAKLVNNKINFIRHHDSKFDNIVLKHLQGQHQQLNSSLACEAINHLTKTKIIKLQQKQIIKSIQNTSWPGRFQIISQNPTVIYDVAHNSEGIEAFIETFKNLYSSHNYKILICGLEYNKKVKNITNQLGLLFDEIICTETGVRKSMPAKKLKNLFQHKNAAIIQNTHKALNYAFQKANSNDVIGIVGSHFFAPFINHYYKNCFAIHK